MQLTDYPVIHQQVVAWGDMDALGHVNNVMYYRYIESARIHYMDQIRMMQQSFSTVVASNQCKYMRPVFYPDTLKIGVRVEEIEIVLSHALYIMERAATGCSRECRSHHGLCEF